MSFITGVLLVDVLAILVTLAAMFIAYFKWAYNYWENKNVPYLTPSIPFGNMKNPLSKTINLGYEFLEMYNKMKPIAPKHFGMYQIASPTYVPVDLELIKSIMTKDFQHFVDRGVYTNEKDDPIGCHLFAIGGTKWRKLRTKLTPTFTSGKLKSMFQTLVDCGLILEKYMEGTDSKEAIDIKDVLGCYTTDVIGSCAFGLNCNSFEEPDSLFIEYSKRFFTFTAFQSLRRLVATNFRNFARLVGIRLISKEVSDFFMKVVNETVTYREKNNIVRKDFLQLLIELKSDNDSQHSGEGDGKSLTMDEIAAQSLVFFLAGFETSSTAMTFAFYELAVHPEMQDKVRNEIHEVLGKHNNEITYDSVNELVYMRQILDETLRKYPPVPLITRECVEDYKVPGEDLLIEKGTRVIIPILAIHYDEDYYKNPNIFDPDRFNEKNKQARHQYAHLPFGEGPRMCIGLRFGVMQSMVGLTCLLRSFRVTLNTKTELPLKMSPRSTILSTTGGMWLNFEKLK